MRERYRVSLDLAKQLKEDGFPQDDCDAYWCFSKFAKKHIVLKQFKEMIEKTNSTYSFFAAPCVGRLGDNLPPYFTTSKADEGRCFVCHDDKGKYSTLHLTSEADCRALMWLELRQKGLV